MIPMSKQNPEMFVPFLIVEIYTLYANYNSKKKRK
jgi:hypothetical protein